jgi:hypothetical protein
MGKKTVYILHKNGADSHYIALKYLLDQHDIQIKFREFSVLANFFKSITKLNFQLFKKQCINAVFLLKLVLTKNQKVVLGIAPFDKKLVNLSRL